MKFKVLRHTGERIVGYSRISKPKFNAHNGLFLSKLLPLTDLKLIGNYTLMQFLPKNYPESVNPGYLQYVSLQSVAMCISAASSVLSTNAMLVALGIGSNAAPLAAGLNWIIKDGLGQLGGIMFASVVNKKFDENPKRWRLLSSISMDAAATLELCTLLIPQYFLPLAAVANIGKNISFLAAAASRAALNMALSAQCNLADVTAKCATQSMLSSTIGLGLGVCVANTIHSNFSDGSSLLFQSVTLLSFWGLSAASLCANYFSLRHVALNTLSTDKFTHIFVEYLCNPSNDLLLPCDLKKSDIVTFNHYCFLSINKQSRRIISWNPAITIGVCLSSYLRNNQLCIDDIERLLSVFEKENFLVLLNPNNDVSVIYKDKADTIDVLRGLSFATFVFSRMNLPFFQREKGVQFQENLFSDIFRTEFRDFGQKIQIFTELLMRTTDQSLRDGEYTNDKWNLTPLLITSKQNRISVVLENQ